MCFNTLCADKCVPAMRTIRRLPMARVAILVTLAIAGIVGVVDGAETDGSVVLANTNTDSAGVNAGGTVTIRLRAARGRWQPEGPGGPTLTIDAFGEEGKPLMVPAPLIRVVEGTTIALSVRNSLDAPLRIHGLCARDGGACSAIEVAPGDTRSVQFVTGRAGTYHYWASSMGARMPFRELAGALIVDPPGGPTGADRTFVITEWNNFTADQLREVMTADDPGARFLALHPTFTFVINGLSWPETEQLTYRRGDKVH